VPDADLVVGQELEYSRSTSRLEIVANRGSGPTRHSEDGTDRRLAGQGDDEEDVAGRGR